MSNYSKFQPLILILAIILGIFASFNSTLSLYCSFLEEPLLAVLLFFIFFEIDWKDLRNSFNQGRFLILTLLINFIWTPFFAYFLGSTFLSGNFTLQIALLLIMVLPCTDLYLIFTDFAGGNVSLSSALLPINLILQLILLPVYLYSFYDVYEVVHVEFILTSFYDIILPLILAILFKIIFRKLSNSNSMKKAFAFFSEHIEIILLSLIAFSINAANGQDLFNLPSSIGIFIISLITFYVVNFCIGILVSKKCKFSKRNTISFTFLITSRNTPLSLSLASVIFPQNALLSLILLIGPITEIPVSYVVAMALNKILKKERR